MYKPNGYMNAGAEFATHAEACNWFGHSYKQFMRAVARHPAEPDKILWFPQFIENNTWRTWSSKDEETIYEERISNNPGYVRECLNRPDMFKRLVFAKLRPGLYSFKGLYEIDPKLSLSTSTITYRRTANRVATCRRV